ncbi:MAG: hypothetical protein A2017_03320 [Lentisphaerae bacterium GWF2_44_16]|nr:MAG: hypothetical protein A2017_03320 [Lentisphaerae bacterium GWF2_44_16]
MKLVGKTLLVSVFLSFMISGFAQEKWLDTFSAPGLSAKWKIDSGFKENKTSIDTKREVLLFQSAGHSYNHIECKLPVPFQSVQCDINNINDTAATWSPAVILYWDKNNYIQVMTSLYYGLQIKYMADGKSEKIVFDKGSVLADMWYRVRISEETDKNLNIFLGERGTDLKKVAELNRGIFPQEQCTLILGKGTMLPDGKPDFDNNYAFIRDTKLYKFMIDNIAVGDSTEFAGKINESVIASEKNKPVCPPEKLQTAIWPNVTLPETEKTIYFALNCIQPLVLLYQNFDDDASADKLSIEINCGPSLNPIAFINNGKPMKYVKSGPGKYKLTFDSALKLPPGFYGVESREKKGPGWVYSPLAKGSMISPVYMFFKPQKEGSAFLETSISSNGHSGPVRKYETVVLPAPEAVHRQNDLGITFWGAVYLDNMPQELTRELVSLHKNLGVRRYVAHKTSEATVSEIHKAGMEYIIGQWWPYTRQCPETYLPSEGERATEADPAARTSICPEVIAAGEGSYGKFLQDFASRLKETAFDGFMFDYETGPPPCFCERCKSAFIKFSGVQNMKWPEDVKYAGRYHDQWISFRSEQGARYVKIVGDKAREINPKCTLQAWIAGYNYQNTLYSHQIDVSKVIKNLTAAEVPEYTVPNSQKDKDYLLKRIMKSIDTIEASVKVSGDKPVIYCASIAYPPSDTGAWSSPEMMDSQICAIIGKGARGLSFWGAQILGGIDGRFIHKIKKWNDILSEAGPFLEKGSRKDDAVYLENVEGCPYLVKSVWCLDGKALLFVSNFTDKAEKLDFSNTCKVNGWLKEASLVPEGKSINLGSTLTLNPFESKVILLKKPYLK